jgi:hypothetical protein
VVNTKDHQLMSNSLFLKSIEAQISSRGNKITSSQDKAGIW